VVVGGWLLWLVVGGWLLVVGGWLLVVGGWLLVVGGWLLWLVVGSAESTTGEGMKRGGRGFCSSAAPL